MALTVLPVHPNRYLKFTVETGLVPSPRVYEVAAGGFNFPLAIQALTGGSTHADGLRYQQGKFGGRPAKHS
jgi:hypothetical protein